MVDLATANVPGARFVRADVREWTSPPESWDAVCAYFSFLQMPRADTEAVLGAIASWLVPGGYLSFVTVPMDVENVPVEFLGHRVELISFSAEAIEATIVRAGLRVVSTHSELFEPHEPDAAPEEHLLITARRSAA
ncbi:class I SAM-dependent methyltransferase [Amycolatopsis acididurans]|uniref:class I SAM-dependent methyltransferase n=1 Tax=Amycolatopsis acididurans TaxID=2724524 RepID=UPI001FEC9F87|nr:class I SAM-dependent methyltransferase [Amycolatopsis acididurans]